MIGCMLLIGRPAFLTTNDASPYVTESVIGFPRGVQGGKFSVFPILHHGPAV